MTMHVCSSPALTAATEGQRCVAARRLKKVASLVEPAHEAVGLAVGAAEGAAEGVAVGSRL